MNVYEIFFSRRFFYTDHVTLYEKGARIYLCTIREINAS